MPPGTPLEGFPESLRGHFRGVSEDIRKAFFGVRAPFWSCVREQMKPKLGRGREAKLGTSDLNVNSDPDSNLTNRTRQFKLKLELYFGLQCTKARPRTPSLAELPLHFFSGNDDFYLPPTAKNTK